MDKIVLHPVSKDYLESLIQKNNIQLESHIIKQPLDNINFTTHYLVGGDQLFPLVYIPCINIVLIPKNSEIGNLRNATVEPIVDSWILESKEEEKPIYTLNEIKRGSVCYASYTWPASNKSRLIEYTKQNSIKSCSIYNKITGEKISFELRVDTGELFVGFEEKRELPYDYYKCKIKEAFIKKILFELL